MSPLYLQPVPVVYDYENLQLPISGIHFDDHSGGNGSLTKAAGTVKEKDRPYRGLNFFSERNLKVLELISRGEYITFGMQGKDIRRHLEDISPSAMSGIISYIFNESLYRFDNNTIYNIFRQYSHII